MENGGEEGGDNAAKDASGKIFVGGISWETTAEKLASHFKKYGEVTDSIVMKDRVTGHSRGFGFITFADPSVSDKVIKHTHLIDGRTVEIKRSIPRDQMFGPKTKRIFVGGLPPSLTDDEFKKHFSKYGAVAEYQIMREQSSGRSRGFGFITFDSEQVVDNILSEGKMHELAGKQVEIKKAEPKKPVEQLAQYARPPTAKGGYGPRDFGYSDSGDGYGRPYGTAGYTGGPYRSPGGYGPSSGYGYDVGYGTEGYNGGYGTSGYGGYGSPVGGYGAEGGLYGSFGGGVRGGYGIDDGYGRGYGDGYNYGYGTSGGLAGGGYDSRYSAGSGTGRYHPYGRY